MSVHAPSSNSTASRPKVQVRWCCFCKQSSADVAAVIQLPLCGHWAHQTCIPCGQTPSLKPSPKPTALLPHHIPSPPQEKPKFPAAWLMDIVNNSSIALDRLRSELASIPHPENATHRYNLPTHMLQPYNN